jgi:hypothetical protein
MRLVELAIFHILGNMEDEKVFSILSLMKSKLLSELAKPLNITICIFVKNFFTNVFPFKHAITNWNDGNKTKAGVNA